MNLLFCILLLVVSTYSVVHKFAANQVQLSAENSISRNNYLNSILKQRNPEAFARNQKMKRQLKSKFRKKSSGSVKVTETGYILIGNISVGTPPQTFSVEFDPFYTRDLNLIDSDANTKFYGETATKNKYNSSASSTYVKKDGNFTYEGSGHKGSDIVKISELSTRMTFGVLDKVGYRYQSEPVDGMLGLYLSPSFNNLSDAAIQLVGQLDQPVISVWINSTPSGNGSAQFTFGAEDTDHCQSTSGYVPLIEMGYSYSFHLSTANINVNGTQVSIGMNDTVHFSPWLEHIYCDQKFLKVIVNASGAVYNKSYGRYDVDCKAKKAGQVTLNIGGEGNTTSSSNKQIVLTGADYIRYDTSSKTCYVTAISAPWYQGFVELGMDFLRNHCFSYNVNENTIAFAKVK